MRNINDLINSLIESIKRMKLAVYDCGPHSTPDNYIDMGMKFAYENSLELAKELKDNMETDIPGILNNWNHVDDIDGETPIENQPLEIVVNGTMVELGFYSNQAFYTYGCIRMDKEIVELEGVGPGRVSFWRYWIEPDIPSPPKG